MKHKTFFLSIILLFTINNIFSQDPIFSNSRINSKIYNPAVYGLFRNWAVSTNYRNLFEGIGSEFSDANLNFEFRFNEKQQKFGAMGGGLNATKFYEGMGAITTNLINLNYNFIYIIDKSKNFFSLGIKAGIINKTLNQSNFIFSDQLDPVLGNVLPTSYTFNGIDNVTKLDFGAGLCFYYENLSKYEDYYNIEFAVNHISFPVTSFENTNMTQLTPLIVFAYNSGYIFDNSRTLKILKPNFFLAIQKKTTNIIVSTDYSIKNISIGAGIRNINFNFSKNQAFLILRAGIISNKFDILYNYEHAVLNSFKAFGIHEISLNIYLERNNNMNINKVTRK